MKTITALWIACACFAVLIFLSGCSQPMMADDSSQYTGPPMTLEQAEAEAALIMETTPPPAQVQYAPPVDYTPPPVQQFYNPQVTPMLPAPAYQAPVNTTCNTLGDQTSCTSY